MALRKVSCCAGFLLIHGVINATAQCEPRNLLGPDELASGRPYVPGVQGPSGGIGGVYCATNDVHPLWQLKSIVVKSKNAINSINISYDVSADPHAASLPNPFPRRCGGDGGDVSDPLILNPDEYITRISGHYGNFVESLYIQTANRRSMANQIRNFGVNPATAPGIFDYIAPEGMVISGLVLKACTYIDAVGVVLQPLQR